MTVPVHMERVAPTEEFVVAIGHGELVTLLFTEPVTPLKLVQLALQVANLADNLKIARRQRARLRKR